MQLSPLKHVTIVTEAIIQDQIIAKVLELGASGCTYHNTSGTGSRGVRRGGQSEDDVNVKIEVVCAESVAQSILTFLSHTYFDNYACLAYLSDVMVMRGARFVKSPS